MNFYRRIRPLWGIVRLVGGGVRINLGYWAVEIGV